jgi:anti-sigma factor RsiW
MDELDDERLNEYLDGELDAAARTEVEAWLAQSPAARARLAELEGLFAAFTAVTDLPLTTDLTPAILAALPTRPEAAPAPWWLRFLPLAQLAAAAILIILFWTTLQAWWQDGRTLFLQLLPTLQRPEMALGERIGEWTDAASAMAVWQNIQITPPQFDLATSQWAVLVGLALVLWLFGNRLLFTDSSSSGRSPDRA